MAGKGKGLEGSKVHEAQGQKPEEFPRDRRSSDEPVKTDDTGLDSMLLNRLHLGETLEAPSYAGVPLPSPTYLQQVGQDLVQGQENREVPKLLPAPVFYSPKRQRTQTSSSSADSQTTSPDDQLLGRIQRGELSPAIPRSAAAEYFSNGPSALQRYLPTVPQQEQDTFVAQYFTTRPTAPVIPTPIPTQVIPRIIPQPMNIPYFPLQQTLPNFGTVQTFMPAPSMVPFGFPQPVAANQGYPHWTVDITGTKKDCFTLLMERLERGHAETLSEEFHAYAKGQEGKTWREEGLTAIVLAERGVQRNFPYANLDHAVQESTFLVGATVYSTPFTDLKDAVLGVEATSYLQHMLDDTPTNEPLLAALGGDPIALKAHIESDLDRWKENKIRPLFVFDGQSVVGKDEMALRQARVALTKTQKAWDMYSKNQPEEAVRAFGAAGAVRAHDLYRLLQEILDDRNLEYLIAPFNACAQLAYMDRLEEQLIDGVMGSKELLLYDIYDSMFNHPTAADWEKKQFTGIIKSELVAKLNITPEMLADALLMVGTSFLSPFPPLQVESIISSQPYTLTDAINLLRTSDKSVTNTCVSFHDILEKRDPGWLDKYRRAKMAVKHCITVDVKGNIHIRDYDNLTNDQHLYLGLQMPAELYHYLSKALIGPTIMNCFVHRDLIVLPTLDGFASDEYKKLVSRDLVPLKETTAALISSRIHRAIQHYEIVMKFWFDDTLKQTIVHRNLQPQTNQKVDPWGVKDKDLKAQAAKLNLTPGTIAFAILSLQDSDFRAKTFRKPDVILEGKSEISASVLWRLLHLRNYINDQHELTSYGKALAAILKSIGPHIKTYWNAHHVEEAAFLAMELIRFDVLNARNRHNDLIGGALRGSDEDKANCILIGRVACLLKLRHRPIGYTGPLSKNFLNFHSMIKAVRETDRDLLEAVLASMLLNAQAVRPSDDCARLGRSLPLCADVDTSLGIAVKTYLDDYYKVEWTEADRIQMIDMYVIRYLPHSLNFGEDLDVAFKFFDAIYEGVCQLGDEVSQTDKTAWESAKAFLDKRH